MRLLAFLSVLLAFAPAARSVEYQWSVAAPGVVSDETKSAPRAYLWIPPDCRRVRAIVVGQYNMLEEPVLAHPAFRAALAELGFAAVWITPALDGKFRHDLGAGAHFEALFRALAEESGYAELALAPVVPVGHSAMASYPYHFAAWNPGRTLAAISVKGTWPNNRNPDDPAWTGSDVAGVPLLLVSGEYEWAEERAGKALPFRKDFPAVPFSFLPDAGGGHFDEHDALAYYLSGYLRAAAAARLPATIAADPAAPVKLRPIDATKEGWLVDRWRTDKAPSAPAAPVGRYTGDPAQAFWCFDERHALATERMQSAYAGKKPQLLGYIQNGALIEQNPKAHQQVTLRWSPDPAGDGITFKLAGNLLKTGPGDLVMESGGNTFTGSLTISAGLVTARVNKVRQDLFVSAGASFRGQASLALHQSDTHRTVLDGTLVVNSRNDASAHTARIGRLAGAGLVTSTGTGLGTVEISGDGVFQGVITGPLGLVKTNIATTLELTRAHTYSGPTQVSAGTLIVSGSLPETTALTLDADATLARPLANGALRVGTLSTSAGARLRPVDAPADFDPRRAYAWPLLTASAITGPAPVLDASALPATTGLFTLAAGPAGLALNHTPTPYAAWQLEQNIPAFSSPSADANQNGRADLLDYALPAEPGIHVAPETPPALALTFTRHRPELTYLVEASPDLTAWTVLAANPGVLGQPVTVADSEPAAPRRFMRIRIQSNDAD